MRDTTPKGAQPEPRPSRRTAPRPGARTRRGPCDPRDGRSDQRRPILPGEQDLASRRIRRLARRATGRFPPRRCPRTRHRPVRSVYASRHRRPSQLGTSDEGLTRDASGRALAGPAGDEWLLVQPDPRRRVDVDVGDASRRERPRVSAEVAPTCSSENTVPPSRGRTRRRSGCR